VLTRDTAFERAKALIELGNVELLEGTFTQEAKMREGFRSCDYAFINIDGFNAGEKNELYWGIRAYELALEEGVKFYIHGNLDYGYKKGGYDPKFRAGHYDSKGRVGEWVRFHTDANGTRMGAALFTSGPYLEMILGQGTPMSPVIEEDGTVCWKVPLGAGAVPHVALDDCGYYVKWLFDNQERANGMNLEIAVEHVDYNDLAAAFTRVTGKPAKYVDVDLDWYWQHGPMASAAKATAGYNAGIGDPASMNIRDNFTGFWNLFKHSAGNKGVLQRNYELLDDIHPNRIKTAEQWLQIEHQKDIDAGLGGLCERAVNLKPVLKVAEDKRVGAL